jgi:hypothetical protein
MWSLPAPQQSCGWMLFVFCACRCLPHSRSHAQAPNMRTPPCPARTYGPPLHFWCLQFIWTILEGGEGVKSLASHPFCALPGPPPPPLTEVLPPFYREMFAGVKYVFICSNSKAIFGPCGALYPLWIAHTCIIDYQRGPQARTPLQHPSTPSLATLHPLNVAYFYSRVLPPSALPTSCRPFHYLHVLCTGSSLHLPFAPLSQ